MRAEIVDRAHRAVVEKADTLIKAGRPHDMPYVSYGDARVIMTRTDFLDSLDRLSLVSMFVASRLRHR